MKNRGLFSLLAVLALEACSLALPARGQGISFNADGTGYFMAHPAAAVEIRSSGKGVLLPRLSRSERLAMAVDSSVDGLVVYQHDGNRGFYLVQGGEWLLLNPVWIPDGSGEEVLSFAKVAYTGDYEDLSNRPDLSALPGTGLARVAYTGRYEDLEGKPVVPESLDDISAVALSGDYADLVGVPEIPARLRELEADSLHRTVTQGQKSVWDEAASRSVPSRVSDMEEDAYYMAVALEEREAWDAHASVPVPSRLGDLEQDEFAQLVSDADIRRWDSSARRAIPARLRDLEPDSLHRTVTEQQRDRWLQHEEALAFSGNYMDLSNRPDILLHLSQYEDDELHRVISYRERDVWDSAYRRRVPTRLSELADDNMDYRLVSDAEAARWDSMAARPVAEYPDTDENAFILHGDPSHMANYRALSQFGRQGTWSSLSGRPTFSAGTAPVTGSYADLDPESLPRLQAAESGVLSSLSYRDVLHGKPDLYLAFAESGHSRYVAGRPEYLSEFLADDEAAHVSANDKKLYRQAMEKLLVRGVPAPEDYAMNEVEGTYASLRLSGNLTLDGIPVSGGPYPSAEEVWDSGEYDHLAATAGMAQALDAYAVAEAGRTAEPIPEGLVMMWAGGDLPPVDAQGGCWKRFDALSGRFPVGAKVSDDGLYPLGAAGGAAEVALTEAQLPPHTHPLAVKEVELGRGNGENARRVFKSEGLDLDRTFGAYQTEHVGVSYNSFGYGEDGSPLFVTGTDGKEGAWYETEAHNNMPPWFGIVFIVYTTEGCPSK